MKTINSLSKRRAMHGAATVEYAVTVVYWVALTFAVMEMGRVMYLVTATFEATRIGARYAVVCAVPDEQAVKDRMTAFLPILTDSDITITYAGNTCTKTNCASTNVRISNVSFNTIIPMIPLSFTLPAAQTSLYPETRRNNAASETCT